ncbi:MAG: peptidoglycan-binding protein [Pseudomonadota bacterium]
MAKLTLTRCTVEDGQTTEQSGSSDIFEVSINPADYKHTYGISYSSASPDEGGPIGKSGVTPKFSNVSGEKVSFSITIDGTGVVEDEQDRTVGEQIDSLKTIAYTYSGTDHEPNVVKISWGSGLTAFYGRMESMTVNYTLFKATGEALRAKVDLSFVSFCTQMEEALSAQRSSPDMTHTVQVRAGDTLPLLCQKIYRDASKYVEIAQINGLDGFRALAAGTVLRFPPMR